MPDPSEQNQSDVGSPGEMKGLADLLNELAPPPPHSLDLDALRHTPKGDKDVGWQNCLRLVEKHDNDLCKAHREQIDTLLVFAGLFSAVVTAFAVESYQWLQDDPAETSVQLLRDAVNLMAHSLNQTVVPSPRAGPRLSAQAVVRINTFWFLSLFLSLSAALVAILCKQWLREYERDLGQSPETTLGVRHIRFQGLEYWKVGSIVTSVPLVLQLALALFVVGAVDLLWQLNSLVAYFATSVAGMTLAFYVATTFLPVVQYAWTCQRCMGGNRRTGNDLGVKAFMQPQCAFKSAQAWLALRVVQPVIDRLLEAYAPCFTSDNPRLHPALVLRPVDSWVTFDINWMKRCDHIHAGPRCAYNTLSWIAAHLEEPGSSSWIWHCVWAHALMNRHKRDDLFSAAEDIRCVSQSYPPIAGFDFFYEGQDRAQVALLGCSLRSDIAIDTALELVLRIAPHRGVDSHWTPEALRTVRHVHRESRIRLSDDISMGLLRLAELLTQAIIRAPIDITRARTDDESKRPIYAVRAFQQINKLLYDGCQARERTIPTMSALALEWLGEKPFEPFSTIAKDIMTDVVSHYAMLQCDRQELRRCPGIIFPARLAVAVVELWPSYPGIFTLIERHKHVLLELLSIAEHAGPISTDPRTIPHEGVHLEASTSAGDGAAPFVGTSGHGAGKGVGVDLNSAASPRECCASPSVY